MGYPSGVITFTENTSVGQVVQPQYFNDPYTEIVAIETGLLTGFQHNIAPSATNTYTVGTSSDVWKEVFAASVHITNRVASSSTTFAFSTASTSTVVSSGFGVGPITPVALGAIELIGFFSADNTTIGSGVTPYLKRNTTGVPSASASAAGDTTIWPYPSNLEVGTNGGFNFMYPIAVVDTTVSNSTAYYYYLALITVGGGVAQITSPSIVAREFA